LDSSGLLLLDNHIYVPDADDLHLCICKYKHDHILSGHFSQNHILELIHQEYVWLNLQTGVKDYCKSCTSCAHSKTPHHKPYGLLKQLLILEKPWNSISMDFIKNLPASNGFTSILVIVDHISKQAIFIPTYNEITSIKLANLFVLHVFSKHGVPSHVTSN